jgi:hypothetical protein
MLLQFFNGIKDSLRYDIIYHKFFRYNKIRKTLLKSIVLNFLIICNFYIIFSSLSLQLSLQYNKYTTIIYYIFYQIPILIISLIYNNIWRNSIVNAILNKNKNKYNLSIKIDKNNFKSQNKNLRTRISQLKIESDGNLNSTLQQNKYYKFISNKFISNKFIHKFIHDNIFIFIWYIFNWIILIFIKYFPFIFENIINNINIYFYIPYINIIIFIVKFFSYLFVINYTCIIYSTYCIEYKIKNMYPSDLFINKLTYIENHLIYYSGFTLSIVLLSLFCNHIIFWGISEFLLTNLLIISMYIKPQNNNNIPIYFLQKKIIPNIVNYILIKIISCIK